MFNFSISKFNGHRIFTKRLNNSVYLYISISLSQVCRFLNSFQSLNSCFIKRGCLTNCQGKRYRPGMHGISVSWCIPWAVPPSIDIPQILKGMPVDWLAQAHSRETACTRGRGYSHQGHRLVCLHYKHSTWVQLLSVPHGPHLNPSTWCCEVCCRS